MSRLENVTSQRATIKCDVVRPRDQSAYNALRINLFKRHQDHKSESPAHRCGADLFRWLVEQIPLIHLGENNYMLNTADTFAEIKQRYRGEKSTHAIELPIRDWRENLLIHYPIADQRSF